MAHIDYLDLGLVDYAECLDLQERIQAGRIEGKVADTLLFLEHKPVITLGTRGDPGNIRVEPAILEAAGITIHEVSRGGDVTYHGPGQLVGYPIVHLSLTRGSIRALIDAVFTTFRTLLAEDYGIVAEPDTGKRAGLWIGREKILALGISVKRNVTMHGFAFNVNTDLSQFDLINPCGLTGYGVTSIRKITGQMHDMERIKTRAGGLLAASLGVEMREISLQTLFDTEPTWKNPIG